MKWNKMKSSILIFLIIIIIIKRCLKKNKKKNYDKVTTIGMIIWFEYF